MDARSLSIAVMPFRNLSPEPDTELFAIGFAEDLIADLTRFPSLSVLASQSSFGLSELGRAVEDVAGDWDLQYVLEGSVRRAAKTVRVSVQLIRVHGRETLWAERFDAPLDEVFSIQDQITATVAGKLAGQLDDARLAVARRRPIDKLPAYDCWLRGMDCLKRGTLEGDEEARPFFHQALEIDPQYARAYCGLSLSHFNEWTCQAWHLWDENEDSAFDYATRAVQLDGTDAMAHSVLGRVYRFRRQHEQADRHLTRALTLNPNDAHVLIQVAIARLFNGDFEEGYQLARKAIQLNPLHAGWYPGIVGWNLFMMGRYADALPFLEAAGEAIVNFAAYRAACAASAGDTDRARKEYELFLQEYREKIAFGREPEPGEALRWAVQVEPFRRMEDSCHMPEVLREAEIDEIDTGAALEHRRAKLVRPAEINVPPGDSFTKEGRIWSMSYDGNGAQLVELKGFHDLARLLALPGESVHCLELSGAPPTSGAHHDVLDAEARRAYRRRIEELQIELDQAEADNDLPRVDRVRAELDSVVDELANATGLGGRSRRIADPTERARSAVTWRIRSAIKKIRAAHPRLGQHLLNSVRTGVFCVYSPEIPTEWQL